VFFFFFQAEDGIRDFHVTGVQTCALPISGSRTGAGCPGSSGAGVPGSGSCSGGSKGSGSPSGGASGPGSSTGESGRCPAAPSPRSEERRVGKECRCGGAPYREEEQGEVEW